MTPLSITAEQRQRQYNLDTTQLYSQYGHLIPPVIQDLLAISSQIIYEDRMERRPRYERRGRDESRGWVRSLAPTLRVRNPEFWSTPHIHTLLTELLTWLSEDNWSLSFAKAQSPSVEQEPLFPTSTTNDLVVLYSGGLDSLAGTVNLLHLHPDRSVVLMSGLNDSLKQLVHRQVGALQHRFSRERVKESSITFEVIKPVKRKKEEETQRTRSFRFLAYGAAEAIIHGASQVAVCENGIGAINLPLSFGQLGAQHTRATHPRTLRLMGKLMEAIGYPQIEFIAPFLLWTKGEMCAYLHEQHISRMSLLTVSCDSFPLHVQSDVRGSMVQCGTCTSCILRRQSLLAAGIHSKLEDRRYLYNLFEAPRATDRSDVEPLLMMIDQVVQIDAAANSTDPVQTLRAQFPDLTLAINAIREKPAAFGLSSEADAAGAIADLLHRYAQEWKQFERLVILA